MSVPNIITILRFLIIPFYTVLLVRGEFLWALLLFVLSAFSDILDGYLARRLNQTTDLGKILDPVSDKIIILISLIFFAFKNYLPFLGVIIFLVKELLMLLVGLYFLFKHIEITSSRFFGKSATVFTSASIIMILMRIPYAEIVFLIGLSFSILAGLDYLSLYLKRLKAS